MQQSQDDAPSLWKPLLCGYVCSHTSGKALIRSDIPTDGLRQISSMLFLTYFHSSLLKNSLITARGILHSRPTFTAGSSPFIIILRTCWQVVRRKSAVSLTVRISFMPMDHAFYFQWTNALRFVVLYRCNCAAYGQTPFESPSCHIDLLMARCCILQHTASVLACPFRTDGRPPQLCKSLSCCCNR